MKTETLDYFDHETQLEAFLAWDDLKPGKKPAVLVAHDWTGRREFAENKAKEMAKLGYVGFALDMYGDGFIGSSNDENSSRMQPLLDDRKELALRVSAAYERVIKIPGVDHSKIAIIGYCLANWHCNQPNESGCREMKWC